MKHNEWENDGFDELLRDALASDAAPSGDFTELRSHILKLMDFAKDVQEEYTI